MCENIEKTDKETVLNWWLLDGVKTVEQLKEKIRINIRNTKDPEAKEHLLWILHNDLYAEALLGLDKFPAVSLAGEDFGWL
jgi:hypothetical protein